MNGTVYVKLTQQQIRENAVRECLTWLAVNHANYKSEYLCCEMAQAMLPEYKA